MKLLHRNTLLCCMLWLTTPSYALDSDFSAPIDIEAEYVEVNAKTNSSTYRGKVVITRGSMILKADSIEVTQTTEGAVQAIAIGAPALYQQTPKVGSPPVIATASQISYSSNKAILLLKGSAEIKRNQDTVSSDTIKYQMQEDRIVAGQKTNGTPKDRVKITLQPKGNLE